MFELSYFIKKGVCLLFFSMLGLLFLQGQNTINSKLINLKTKEAVVFATIRIKGKNLATISDENGNFRIPEKYKATNDTLQISSIGFKSKTVLIQSLKEGIVNIIPLDEALENLSEVVIYGTKKKRSNTGITSRNENILVAEGIVKKAIDRIPVNYPRVPHSYVGYYRDYQFQNKEYINLNEALAEVFDEGFQTNKSFSKYNQTKLLEYKTNTNFKIDSTTTIAYDNNKDKLISSAYLSSFGGNELSILNIHDPIRNYNRNSFSAIYILQKDFISNHQFSIVKTILLDQKQLYHIKFVTNKEVENSLFFAEGNIYIEKETFAIHKLEYNGFRVSVINRPYGPPTKFVDKESPLFALKLEYAKHDKLMYLNYISFNNTFQVRNDFKNTDIEYDAVKNEFILSFNKSINPESALKTKNYKFTYLKKGLKIKDIKLVSENKIKVQIENKANFQSNIKATDFEYKLKGIKDAENNKIGKGSYHLIDQYREFFVQKVFPSKKLPNKTLFMFKNSPLTKSKDRVSKSDTNESYWINTPLKRSKSD